jgi:signal transduction histidine kinase
MRFQEQSMPRLLVVENESNPRESIAETLRETYFEVETVENTTEALLKAQSSAPDLMICDMTSLNLDGNELLELIRADPQTRSIPFILIAGRYDKNTMRRAMNLGADDYLIRPFTTQELLESVMVRLHRHQVLIEAAEMRLDKTKRTLARMLTHELRTPLISMNTAVDIVLREAKLFTLEEMRDLLETLAAGSIRLSRRVEQLAFITQLQTQTLSYKSITSQRIESRLSDLVMNAINQARRITGRHDDSVTIKHGDAAADAFVVCNPPALKQALIELIANAIAYAPLNSTVFVGQKYVPEGVRITVTDQGSGIPEDRLARAMELFAQLDRETNEQQGMGIGLGLAERLIDAHGGRMEIRSVVGKGTQVLVYLPGIAPNGSDDSQAAAAAFAR